MKQLINRQIHSMSNKHQRENEDENMVGLRVVMVEQCLQEWGDKPGVCLGEEHGRPREQQMQRP